MMRKLHSAKRMLVVLVEAFLISWALSYLSEYFGWTWHSEAGGAIERRVAPPA